MCFFAMIVYRVFDCFYVVDERLGGKCSGKGLADWCSESLPAWKESIGIYEVHERSRVFTMPYGYISEDHGGRGAGCRLISTQDLF
jgi:hypothetical protein